MSFDPRRGTVLVRCIRRGRFEPIELPPIRETSDIWIGTHGTAQNKVVFMRDGIEVGCTFIRKETVALIYHRLFGL